KDILVGGIFQRSAGISGNRALHARDVLEDTLDTPEAAAGKDRRLKPGCIRHVDRGRWNLHRTLSRRLSLQREGGGTDRNHSRQRYRQGHASKKGPHAALPSAGHAMKRIATPSMQ